jgi:galactokinase
MGMAPGRSTLVGEHVDYAEGLVVAIAVQLGVAACLRRSPDATWRVVSGERRAERPAPDLQGDVADRVLAVAAALGGAGIAVPPLEVGIAADLPEGAGLSSSAALSVAILVAVLRLVGRRLPGTEAARIAHAAESDVLGVPCGTLDQRTVVGAPAGGALLLDFRDGGAVGLPWRLGDVGLVAVDTGAAHDVGGDGYRARRSEANEALALLGAASWRDVTPEQVAAAGLPDPLWRRARHITTETLRAAEASAVLRAADAPALGRLMSASHASLRDDYQVSTPALDACCTAAQSVPGCLGARLVGAGFGGTATALAHAEAAERVRAAMLAALGSRASWGRSWLLEPSAGAAELAPDALT